MSSNLIRLCEQARAELPPEQREQPSVDAVVVATMAALMRTVSRMPAESIHDDQVQRYANLFLRRILME